MEQASAYRSRKQDRGSRKDKDMTMVHYLPVTNRSPHRPSPGGWLNRFSEQVAARYAEWRRDRMLRTLEGLPPETLKDIGWPTAETPSMRDIRK